MNKDNNLERNIGYVVEIVKENSLNLRELTISTRLFPYFREITSIPLNIKEAQDAIKEAEKRGKIRKKKRLFFDDIYKMAKADDFY